VPAFAKLGDMVGHKRMLLVSTAIVAAASLALPFATTFWAFLACWAIQGVYVVWLPLEVALIYSRARGAESASGVTAKAAGVLVAALEAGAIIGALAGGALVDAFDLRLVLLIPGIAVTACFFVILFGVRESTEVSGGRLDTTGLVLVSFALIAFTGGLSLLRIDGPASPLAWAITVLGIALIVPFALWERRHADPIIDVRMFANPSLWPVFLTAGLFGVSVLGAQAPLSTFARTDPQIAGYGLGTEGFATSLIIGIYLVAMIAGALLYPRLSHATSPRLALIVSAVFVGVGYLLFLPMHADYGQVVTNMVIAGLGSGALVASLPATAAAAAPPSQTGVATGLTNSVKTVGGAIASCVFGIALSTGITTGTAGSLAGYMTVWAVCGVTALAAAAALLVVPRGAFRDAVPA
jgi:MFS family permease